MRKSICLLLLLLFSENNLFSQEYQRLVDTNNRWNYVYYLPSPINEDSVDRQKMTYSFFFSGDTLINNTVYIKLMIDVYVYKKPITKYIGALREDTINQQVFFMNSENVESLAYSFNHDVGDTLSIDSLTYLNGYVVRRVKSIDVVDFNSIQRKRIEVCDTLYKFSTPLEIFSDYWIEGIGSFKLLVDDVPALNKLFVDDVPAPLYDFDQPLTLICFWHNDEMIYHDSLYDSCVYIYSDSTSDIESFHSREGIFLYPNPVSGMLSVSCNEPIRKIELLDMDGNLLWTTSINELDVSMLADDIYFIRATTVSARMLIERFIKRTQ
ncbi:MAG: T9SS type A sorting domain-containing protein [Bacteroidales bacterium]|nr:T9SS type A sorting domain-containing protein [Bacteroidales bacterium]